MLKLHFKDLRALKAILAEHHDATADYLFATVSKELDKIPPAMAVICTRNADGEVYLFDERDTLRACQRLVFHGSGKPDGEHYEVILYIPQGHSTMTALKDRIFDMAPEQAWLGNSKGRMSFVLDHENKVRFRFVSNADKLAGLSPNVGIVYSPN